VRNELQEKSLAKFLLRSSRLDRILTLVEEVNVYNLANMVMSQKFDHVQFILEIGRGKRENR